MEAKNILDVEKFVLECNDMLSGKFLDLNKRLEKFLTVMTKSEDVVDFLADCLEDFDEDEEFAKAFSVDRKSGNSKVTIPSDDKARLALTTTIFNDMTSGKLNANQFLETYFKDGKLTSMQNFLEKIIKPFRDLICKYFEISTNVSLDDIKKQLEAEKQQKKEQEEAEKEAMFPHLDELMAEITKTCNQILSLLKFEKKRTDVLDDVEFVTNSIIQACEKQDLMVVNGLVIGLNYCSKKFKNIKHLVEDMNTLIYNYYEYLEESAQGKSEIEEEEKDFSEDE